MHSRLEYYSLHIIPWMGMGMARKDLLWRAMFTLYHSYSDQILQFWLMFVIVMIVIIDNIPRGPLSDWTV